MEAKWVNQEISGQKFLIGPKNNQEGWFLINPKDRTPNLGLIKTLIGKPGKP